MNNILAVNTLTLSKSNHLCFFNIFKITASILIFLLFVAYIFQINTEISEKYLVRQQERKVAELLTETRGMEMVLTQEGSLQALMPVLQTMEFEEAEKINYIQVFDQKVVIK